MLLTLLLISGTAGCAEAPTESVESAKARHAAVAAEAGMYALDAYEAAEEAVSRLDAELEIQANSFVLLRSYEQTSALVSSLETRVDAVELEIGAEKQRVLTETTRLARAAEEAMNTGQESIADIPSEDVPEDQASAWAAELEGVGASLAETERLLAVEELVPARSEAESALAAATGVNTSVATLVAELERLREEDTARRASGDVIIPSAVLANGQRLAAGTYRLSLAEEGSTASGIGSPGRWVEFVTGEDVAGRGLAVVIPDSEIDEVSDSGSLQNEARVVVLKDGDYVRVWLNRDGVNYLLHLPPA